MRLGRTGCLSCAVLHYSCSQRRQSPYTMSHSDSQRRYPFPSRSNDIHRQNNQYPYADEEYVPPGVWAKRIRLTCSPQAYESIRGGSYG